MKNVISFIGLGKLGLPLATNIAKNKNNVIAIDKNVELIAKLKSRQVPWVEERLEENLKLASKFIEYTTSYADAHKTNTSVILVNTPSNKKDGSFSNLYIEQTLVSLCENLVENNKDSHHFILSSTVMPRSIKDTFIPLIENITGWTLNKQFGFSYVPDFVAIGKIIHDFENPDFLLIGSSNEDYAAMAEDLYKTIVKNDAVIKKVNLAEAELCKVSLNAYITTKISFANYLGILAEKLDKEINVDNVTNTIGLDKRIGVKYFKAGTPYGGTCFPRDTWAFEKVSEKVGLTSHQMLANEHINESLLTEIFKKIIQDSPSSIGFIGIGFKPGTSVITEGLCAKLITKLQEYSGKLHVLDKIDEAVDNLRTAFPSIEFVQHNTVKGITNTVDVLVYCNDDEYDQVANSENLTVVDPWRTFQK